MEVLELHWYDHALFFLTAVVIPLLSVMAKNVPDELPEEMEDQFELLPKKHLYYQNGLVLIIGALLVLTNWNAADRNWSGLGFKAIDFNQVVLVCTTGLLLFYITDLVYSYFKKEETEQKIKNLQYVIPLNFSEYKHYVFLAVTAGICEEIIFRGFLINYLLTLLQDFRWVVYLSVLIPAITFGISHYYQGVKAVIKIMDIAVLFGIIYVASESLYLVMAIHIAIDLVSGLSPILMANNEKK